MNEYSDAFTPPEFISSLCNNIDMLYIAARFADAFAATRRFFCWICFPPPHSFDSGGRRITSAHSLHGHAACATSHLNLNSHRRPFPQVGFMSTPFKLLYELTGDPNYLNALTRTANSLATRFWQPAGV
jgi:hypothetical protein